MPAKFNRWKTCFSRRMAGWKPAPLPGQEIDWIGSSDSCSPEYLKNACSIFQSSLRLNSSVWREMTPISYLNISFFLLFLKSLKALWIPVDSETNEICLLEYSTFENDDNCSRRCKKQIGMSRHFVAVTTSSNRLNHLRKTVWHLGGGYEQQTTEGDLLKGLSVQARRNHEVTNLNLLNPARILRGGLVNKRKAFCHDTN